YSTSGLVQASLRMSFAYLAMLYSRRTRSMLECPRFRGRRDHKTGGGPCHRGGPSSWHSLPWEDSGYVGAWRKGSSRLVFPAVTPFCLPVASFPRSSLSDPGKP